MEKFSIKTLFILGLSAAAFLSSCSREIASTASINKMISHETLVSNKAQPKNNFAPCLPDVNIMPQQMADNKTAPAKTQDKASVPPRVKHHRPLLASNFTKEVMSDVKKQTIAITTLGLKQSIASYSGSQHTQGYLGIAGICLIVAIVLAILGFTSAHWFWDLAVILVVAAIVFFLLYLIAKAASPRSE